MSKGANPSNTYNLRSKSLSVSAASSAANLVLPSVATSRVSVNTKLPTLVKAGQLETCKQHFKVETTSPLQISVTYAAESFYESPLTRTLDDIAIVAKEVLDITPDLKRSKSSPELKALGTAQAESDKYDSLVHSDLFKSPTLSTTSSTSLHSSSTA